MKSNPKKYRIWLDGDTSNDPPRIVAHTSTKKEALKLGKQIAIKNCNRVDIEVLDIDILDTDKKDYSGDEGLGFTPDGCPLS